MLVQGLEKGVEAILRKKNLYPIAWFVLGVLSFLLSQPLIRIPILNGLQMTTGFSIFQISHPFLFMLALSFSAGVFEEGFRFIFRKYLVRPRQPSYLQPIIFGLGHGLMEALIILVPSLGLVISGETMTLALVERLIAIVVHISLSVLVWNGFIKDRKYLYLGLAILAHGLVNTVALTSLSLGLNLWLVEGILAVFAILGVIYVIYSKRYYWKGDL